jgi:hypothetical protein
MRKLTAKQKKILAQEWNRLKALGKVYPSVENIPYEVYEAVDALNPCEIFYQNVEHLFS